MHPHTPWHSASGRIHLKHVSFPACHATDLSRMQSSTSKLIHEILWPLIQSNPHTGDIRIRHQPWHPSTLQHFYHMAPHLDYIFCLSGQYCSSLLHLKSVCNWKQSALTQQSIDNFPLVKMFLPQKFSIIWYLTSFLLIIDSYVNAADIYIQ